MQWALGGVTASDAGGREGNCSQWLSTFFGWRCRVVAQRGLLLLKHLQIFAKEILASGVCFWNLLSVQLDEQIRR